MTETGQLAAYPYRYLFALSRSSTLVAYASEEGDTPTIEVIEVQARHSNLHQLRIGDGGGLIQLSFTQHDSLVGIQAGMNPAAVHLFSVKPSGQGWHCENTVQVEGSAVRFIDGPTGSGWGLLCIFDGSITNLYAISLPSLAIQHLYSLPGTLTGGVWLNQEGTLAVNHCPELSHTSGVIINFATRSHTTVFNLSPRSNESILGYIDQGKQLLVSTDVLGSLRCGTVALENPFRIRFWGKRDNLSDTLPCAVTPDRKIVLHEQRGTVSKIHLWDPSSDFHREIPFRNCRIYHHTASASRQAFLLSAPNLPLGLGRVSSPSARGSIQVLHPFPATVTPAKATLRTFSLESSAIESICYNLGNSSTTALVLHGGPVSQWYYEFDPFLQAIAQTGAAVIAPNLSGSTGYGVSFCNRILDGFGEADAEDLLGIRDRYISPESQVLLIGISYGGYLGLRTASRWPDRFAGVVAVSAFSSLYELYQDTSPSVRHMLKILNPGLSTQSDCSRSEVALEKITAELLILHGSKDPAVPVNHARRIRTRLVELGRVEGTDFRYREFPTMGHNLSTLTARQSIFPEVVRYIKRHLRD